MDERLVRLFDDELRHLQDDAVEFGRAFPGKAPALALGENPGDPYVQRLLEGVAFLAARVRLKLEAQFPQFTQSVLETLYPDLLAPVPSMAIVQLTPDPASAPPPGGLTVKRRSRITGLPERPIDGKSSSSDPVPCVFELAQAVRLLPVELMEVRWLVRQVSDSGVDREFGARAALRIRLRRSAAATWKEMALDPLVLFAPPKEGLGYEVIENLFSFQLGLVVRDGIQREAKTVWSRRGSWARSVGFDRQEAVLPSSPRTFEGFRFLREYFALPERFLFFALQGFREALAACKNDVIELVVGLREASNRLEQQVNNSCLELFCAPATNLFSKTFSQVIEPSRYAEFHVVPDANRPVEFEVHAVEAVEGFGDSSPQGRPFAPFFQTRHREKQGGAFFTISRQPRMLTEAERRLNVEMPYAGSEVFLALVDAQQVPFARDLQQLVITARCTNRHLPILLGEGRGVWKLEGGVKAAIAVRIGPTLPSYQPVDGEYAWQLLSAFSTNYLTLADSPDGSSSALRELLALHAGPHAEWAPRQIEGLHRVRAAAIQRPLFVAADGEEQRRISAMGRGLEVTLEFEETAYLDHRAFLLGAVLEQFFARYVSLQSFTETVIKTWPDNRVRMRWPHRAGLRSFV
jgi:type VI secretion system protein ImpG